VKDAALTHKWEDAIGKEDPFERKKGKTLQSPVQQSFCAK
jgi:hypothetical protein